MLQNDSIDIVILTFTVDLNLTNFVVIISTMIRRYARGSCLGMFCGPDLRFVHAHNLVFRVPAILSKLGNREQEQMDRTDLFIAFLKRKGPS